MKLIIATLGVCFMALVPYIIVVLLERRRRKMRQRRFRYLDEKDLQNMIYPPEKARQL